MPIDLASHDQGIEINVSGSFDRAASQQLEDLIHTEVEKNKDIVINLYDVNYISSVSLGTLIRIYNNLIQEGVQVAVSSLSDECKKIFDMVELEKVLPVYPDTPSAFQEFSTSKKNN